MLGRRRWATLDYSSSFLNTLKRSVYDDDVTTAESINSNNVCSSVCGVAW